MLLLTDKFGSSLSLSGTKLFVSAPGQDGLVDNGGALYFYDIIFSSLAFEAVSMFCVAVRPCVKA
jgi:hypothetical protein